MVEICWSLPLYQNQQAHLHLGFQELSWLKFLYGTVVLTIIHHPFKWVIMVIHSTFLSFQWNSWLSETVWNCLLSHLTLSFLEHHHGFANWCSGQLFILAYRSDDLTNNQGLVFSLQWPEIEKKEKTYKTITSGITRCFLKNIARGRMNLNIYFNDNTDFLNTSLTIFQAYKRL